MCFHVSLLYELSFMCKFIFKKNDEKRQNFIVRIKLATFKYRPIIIFVVSEHKIDQIMENNPTQNLKPCPKINNPTGDHCAARARQE